MLDSQVQENSPEVKDAGTLSSNDATRQRFSAEFVSGSISGSSKGIFQGTSPGEANNVPLDSNSPTSGSNGLKISDGAPRITGFLEEPGNGETAVHQAIDNAKQSVQMWMYHLTDPGSIQSLINAHDKGRNVQVILDSASLKTPSFAVSQKQLAADNVDVEASSSAFSISHPKTFLIDGTTSYITSINLTKTANVTRDFGVSTDDPMIASDLNNLFQADLKNAKTGGADTPALVSPFLVVSPIPTGPDTRGLENNQSKINEAVSALPAGQQAAATSDFARATSAYTSLDQLAAERDLSKMPNGSQLVHLFAEEMQLNNIDRIQGVIDRAKTKVIGETENLGAQELQSSIIAAAKRGVEIDLIIPETDRGANYNATAVQALLAASVDIEKQGLPGIHIKEMPGPQSVDNPYTHAKWLVADDNRESYLGSENFTNNSLHHAREIGIIINDAPTMQKMVDDFNHDWSVADGPPFNNSDNQNSN